MFIIIELKNSWFYNKIMYIMNLQVYRNQSYTNFPYYKTFLFTEYY